GIKMIKIGGCEKREKDQFLRYHREFEEEEISLSKLNGLSSMLQEFLLIMILLLSGVYMSYFKNMGSLLASPDKILAYLFLLSRAMPAMASLQSARTSIIGAYGPLARVMEVLHKETDIVQPVSDRTTDPPEIKEIHDISLKNLIFSYNANGRILDDINLDFEKGKMYALVGFSGSGKSTLLDLIASVRNPLSGFMTINGTRTDSSFKQYIGYMNQEPILFHDTIRNNITYFKPDASDEEIWHSLKLAAADDFIRGLPDGLETGLGERGLTVSGGQRQRIGLARVLLQDAPVIMLDEATNALDYQTEKTVYQNLKNLKEGRIIIIAAHRLSTLKDFDHIVVMKKGHIEEQGDHEALIANKSLYYNLFNIQEYSG
ncbi:MAG: ABC transporter ATP-binding protein/permease, partial [Nitrospirota bacterium]|nr:ABC transporter ATP-binding protein/permease [Nitrospirota bacterium]